MVKNNRDEWFGIGPREEVNGLEADPVGVAENVDYSGLPNLSEVRIPSR